MHHPLPFSGSSPTAQAVQGAAVLAKGFRPFFLLAGLFAMLIVPLWLLVLRGSITATPHLDPVTWHAHEMLFGFGVAVIAGFLLTAVGNWTGRETATGRGLLALVLLWLSGRALLLLPFALPRALVAAVDLAFLPVLIAVLARPLLAAQSRRNLALLVVLFGLFLANGLVHGAALGLVPVEVSRPALLVGLDWITVMMLLIAGRVLPMFTKNATGVSSIRSRPWLDRAALAAVIGATLAEALGADGRVVGSLLGLAGVFAVLRARYWGAIRSLREPMLWVLHAGYAWLCVGLLLRGLALWGSPALASPASHALTVGAVGGLTLGMMARVALGHTGRALVAARPMAWAFGAINAAALSRVALPLLFPARYVASLWIAGALWLIAFGSFVAVYAPILLGPRVDGRAG